MSKTTDYIIKEKNSFSKNVEFPVKRPQEDSFTLILVEVPKSDIQHCRDSQKAYQILKHGNLQEGDIIQVDFKQPVDEDGRDPADKWEVYSSKGKLDIRLVVTVGMPATIGFYSDSHPGTVIEVKRNPKGEYKTIVVQEDNSKRSDDNGMSESQSYTYTRNPEGAKYTWTLRKNGRYVEKGRDIGQGVHLGLGYRRKYYDFSF